MPKFGFAQWVRANHIKTIQKQPLDPQNNQWKNMEVLNPQKMGEITPQKRKVSRGLPWNQRTVHLLTLKARGLIFMSLYPIMALENRSLEDESGQNSCIFLLCLKFVPKFTPKTNQKGKHFTYLEDLCLFFTSVIVGERVHLWATTLVATLCSEHLVGRMVILPAHVSSSP